jgi:hypothetical protein
MKKQLLLLFMLIISNMRSQTANTFTFTMNGEPPPIGLVDRLNDAAKRWSNYVKITVPIKENLFLINTNLVQFSGLTLANGRKNFTNAPVSNFIYTTALANQLAGAELNPGEQDMDIYINLATPMYFGTGKPASNQEDFITLIMHEIGHGLGFYSDGYVNASNVGSFGNIPPEAISPISPSFPWCGQEGVPSIFDKFIIKKSGNHLVTIAANNTTMLGDSIKYTTNYFDGPLYANASNGGKPVKLSGGTGTYTLGIDLLHLNDDVCNSIMSYCWDKGDTVRTPAAWEMGILKEIGWISKTPVGIDKAIATKIINVYPNPAQNVVEFSGALIQSIAIYNLQGQMVQQEMNQHTGNLQLDVTELPNGIYFAAIKTPAAHQLITEKMIIVH